MTTTPPQTPSGRQKHGNPAGMVFGFLPWIVYWILVGNLPFRMAVLIAFGVSIVLNLASWLRGDRPKTIEIGGLAVFAVLTVMAFVVDDHFLERWIQPLSNAGLFLVVLVGELIGRPFTYDYAKDFVDERTARTTGFRWFNEVTTWVWIVVFGIMTISSMIPPIVQGQATIHDGASTLSIVCYWVVPMSFLVVGAVFSMSFPQWFQRRSDLVDKAAAVGLGPVSQPEPEPEVTSKGQVHLDVDPSEGLADTPFHFVVAGAAPGGGVMVESECLDLFGRKWRSEAVLRADDAGIVDTAVHFPESGDWSRADPGAPIWAMRFLGPDATSSMFVPPREPLLVRVVAATGGARLQRNAWRRPAGEGVQMTPVHEGDVVGMLARPGGAGRSPAVVCFGGSEGGYESQLSQIALFASHGFVAFAAAWFGVEGMESDIVGVPLERLARAVAWVRRRDEVDPDRVVVTGVSRGAEAALAMASLVPDVGIAGLVLTAPSHVAWQALDGGGEVPGTSSWTCGGSPVPFAPFDSAALMPELVKNAWKLSGNQRRHKPTLMRLARAYESSLDDPAVAAAWLPSVNVPGPILCLAGDVDQVWPSARMARQVVAGRSDSLDSVRIYPGCGHLIRIGLFPTDAAWVNGLSFGGTREGLAAAQEDASRRVPAFISRVTGTTVQPDVSSPR